MSFFNPFKRFCDNATGVTARRRRKKKKKELRAIIDSKFSIKPTKDYYKKLHDDVRLALRAKCDSISNRKSNFIYKQELKDSINSIDIFTYEKHLKLFEDSYNQICDFDHMSDKKALEIFNNIKKSIESMKSHIEHIKNVATEYASYIDHFRPSVRTQIDDFIRSLAEANKKFNNLDVQKQILGKRKEINKMK